MTKALFINGSPRKNGNTAQLLKRAMDGAREAGAETGLVDLYDHSMNFKGCMSCFACKIKGGRKGVCSFRDDLQPVMEKAADADVLVCGSPVYCGYPTAGLRAFMERLIFPAVNYSDFRSPVINKPKRSASIFTMNCPDRQIYQSNTYDILMDVNARSLGMFGPTEILYSFDTYQFNDYSRYDAAQIDERHKDEMRRTQFPEDLRNAYETGKRLVEEAAGDK
ncbi:MAG: Multimeric flavodoxin WrbA [bacterium P3]|nr:MAG: Multimeric flavodoxin WrbA [bacterium P3]KWW38929.1 MAG: Multimeric flavodoxin WrbA [bacterium F083]